MAELPVPNGVMHGPYKPMSEEEISKHDSFYYGRALSEQGRLVLQCLHQVSETAFAWSEADRGREARPLFNLATAIHINLMNGEERLPYSNTDGGLPAAIKRHQ